MTAAKSSAAAVETAEVRPMRRQHRGDAAEVLSESHFDYPSFVYLFPDLRRRRRALRSFFAAAVSDAERLGSADVAEDSRRALLGVALWLPPGAYPWSALRKLRAAPALVRTALAAPGSALALARTGANTERVHPRQAHWYLEALGVRPSAQRRGIGARLITAGLSRADAAGLPSYLETAREENVAYYERFGFAVERPALALVPRGPTHWAMWRSTTDHRKRGPK